ncbi:MAG: DNA polymerase III subunit delta [Treponema sp.]|jgi:DNA polymerase-3 subunit delta|nr:DNA polymerase III subunit delta [Treponema sp.]
MPASKSASGGSYIFLGPEIGKKQDEIGQIKKKLSETGAAAGAYEETVFYAGETPVINIVNIIQNHSLFAQSRLFIIKNAEQIKDKSEKDRNEIKLLASCMKELEFGDALILISDELRLTAALDNACPKENRKVFYEMFEREKSAWVRSFFQREGRSIDPSGIDVILELVENNTDAMQRECSRLMLFLPKDRPATARDVEQWLSHSREESPFTLFARIAAGDISKAVESLHTLLAAKESPVGILALLAWSFRKLRDYLTLCESGEPDNFALKKIGLSAVSKNNYAAASRHYSKTDVERCLAITAEYDILTRASGQALEEILMDVYLLKIMN